MSVQSAFPPSRKWSVGSLVGATVTAFLASACCLGPLVLAAFGLGGAGLLSRFERYRPLFAALTVGLLAAGFYLAYRRPRSSPGCECPTERRQLPRALLWVVSAVAVALLFGGPLVAGLAGASRVPAPQASDRGVSLHVEGMTCAACSVSIGTALAKLDGVRAVRVDLEGKRVSVSYDPYRVAPAALVSAIDGLGYRATVEGK